MQYTSELKRLVLPEYGRNVQQMVDHCMTIEDKAERTRCANTIINIMGNLFPHLRISRTLSTNCGIIWQLCPTSS